MDGVELNSRGYYLWNETLGRVMLECEAGTPVPVASLTKMMTALVAVETKDLEEKTVVTPEALAGLEEFAVIGLKVGQEVSLRDLLYATMLPSAGDAAQALAIGVSGDLGKFVERMNARAAEIGMSKTHFANTYGRDEENYSTPEDMAKLLKVALENPEFAAVFGSFEQELPTLGRSVKKTFSASSGVWGGKTGYTQAAGRCLASRAEIEGSEYILVTVGAENGQHTADAQKVYQAIRDNYEPVKVVRAGERLVTLGVAGSPTRGLDFAAESERTVALPNGTRSEDLKYQYDGVREITRQTEPEGRLGTYRILQDGQEVFAQEIYYHQPVEFYQYAWVGVGAAVSAILLGLTIGLGIWKWKKPRKRERGWKRFWPAMLAGGLFVVSVGVNVALFHDWFEPADETEIWRPELILATEENDDQAEAAMQVEETAEERRMEKASQSQGEEKVTPVLGNCTTNYGNLMLINPNFRVGTDFIAARKRQLVSVSRTYGIPEYKAGNGDNLLLPEAAEQLNKMVKAYEAENPGHEMGTRSCFRERGTTCGRLCAATGTSDHHTGLTCDLVDNAYGTALDTDEYAKHKEWQWLKENSYKYGFIDRFPEAWAGGKMSEPLNVDGNGTTGLFETWHYRYVGVAAATEIATGKYNNGRYDSLEHYLKMTGRVKDLKGGGC